MFSHLALALLAPAVAVTTCGSLLLQKGSFRASLEAQSELVWEEVDGGMDRACRGNSASDNSNAYYEVHVAETLDGCKALCSACTGIEYKSSTGRCEVWTQDIGASAGVAGFQCLRPVPRDVTTTAVSTSPGLPEGWEHVDGGVNRACRGDSPQDNSNSYFNLSAATSLEECMATCSAVASWEALYVKGAFFSPQKTLQKADFDAAIKDNADKDGNVLIRRQCKNCGGAWNDIYIVVSKDFWGSPWEILMITWQDAGFKTDFSLYSTFQDARTGANPWQFCNGGDTGIGFPRDCGPAGPKANVWNSLTRGGQSDWMFSVFKAGVPGCTGIEYSHSSGRCELWQRPIGASIALNNFECIRIGAVMAKPLPEGWQHVDGGVNRACRGESPQDNSNSFYTVVAAATLEQCIDQCSPRACTGVEYSSGRCELWNVDIGASISLNGFECLRRISPATSTATSTTTTTTGAFCGGPIGLNDFSSKLRMEQAGWVFDWADPNDFKPSPGSAGLPQDSYWGYKFPGDGSITVVLQKSGTLTLDFGNSWSAGLVSVYLNENLQDSALPTTPSQTVTFSFSHLDVLRIEEAPDAVMVINSISFNCPTSCSSSEDCPDREGVCVAGLCRECSVDADCGVSGVSCIDSRCREPDAFHVVTSEHRMARPMAQAMPWTLMPGSGLCGATCRVPRRISTISCGNRLVVAWTAHVAWEPNPEYGPNGTRGNQGLWQEVTVGHVSEFQVDAGGATSFLSDHELHDCNDVGNVAASPTCDVVAVLCRSAKPPADMGARDFQAEAEQQYGKQFGWYVPSQPDPSKDNYRIVDHMYLLEWASGEKGQTAQAPHAIVHLGKNIGGWNYGHWDISLNRENTVYAIALKTTIGPPRADEEEFDWGWHEGSVNYAINRNDWSWNRAMGGGWGSGCGHILENRITANDVAGTWLRFYGGDARDFWSRSTCVSTMQDQAWHDIYHIPPSKNAGWHGTGGPFNVVSRGEEGWLGIMLAPDPDILTPANESVEKLVAGLVEVPLDVAECGDGACAPKVWLKELPATQQIENGSIPEQKLGMLNLQSLGEADENSRLLLGWASVRTSGSTGMAGFSTEYYIAEIDEKGNLKSKSQALDGNGWGEDNAWAAIPSMGCVAWAFTWNDMMSKPYGNSNRGGDVSPGEDEFSDILQLTVACPR